MSLPASDRTKQPDNRTTMELGAVLPRTAEVRDDHLFIGGVDMVDLAHENQQTLVLVTHDRELAEFADRIVTLIDGNIVSDKMNEHPRTALSAPPVPLPAPSSTEENSHESETAQTA